MQGRASNNAWLVKPKFFVPAHGEYRHLMRHATLAENGGKQKNIFLMSIGQVLEVEENSARINGAVPAGKFWLTVLAWVMWATLY